MEEAREKSLIDGKIDFIKLLNIRYDNAYDFLRVRSVDLDVEGKTVSIQFGVPYSGENSLTEEDKKYYYKDREFDVDYRE